MNLLGVLSSGPPLIWGSPKGFLKPEALTMMVLISTWGFPKIRGTFFGADYSILGVYIGVLVSRFILRGYTKPNLTRSRANSTAEDEAGDSFLSVHSTAS